MQVKLLHVSKSAFEDGTFAVGKSVFFEESLRSNCEKHYRPMQIVSKNLDERLEFREVALQKKVKKKQSNNQRNVHEASWGTSDAQFGSWSLHRIDEESTDLWE